MNDEKNRPADEKPEAETVDSNGIKNQFNAEAEPQQRNRPTVTILRMASRHRMKQEKKTQKTRRIISLQLMKNWRLTLLH